MYCASPPGEPSLTGNSFSSFLDSLTSGDDQLSSEAHGSDILSGQNEISPSDEVPSMTLTITNVVCMANMRCHLRLKELARAGVNVEYKALQNHVIMRLRKPYTVATIWSSGKIWCTGANSLSKARQGARRIARRISQVGFPCRFSNYRIVNIMATCRLPFRVRLDDLVKVRPRLMSYEPELAPGLNFKTEKDSSTSLKLFTTGRVVIMGSSLENIGSLVEEIVPLAALHQTDEPLSDSDEDRLATVNGVAADKTTSSASQRRQNRRRRQAGRCENPFAEIVACDIPALADVLLSEEAGLADDALFDILEEEDDAACTDNDSEDETSGCPVVGLQADGNSTSWQPPMPMRSLTDEASQSGNPKRACVTAYSEDPTVTPVSQTAVVSSSITPLTTPQPQFIFTGTPNLPTTTVVPIQFATAPMNGVVHQPRQQFATFAAATPLPPPPSVPNSQSKVITVGAPGQANIVRIMSPMQFTQLAGPSQPTRFILNRLPVGATIINPSAFVMAASPVPIGGLQFATTFANHGQSQIITANGVVTSSPQQNLPGTTFVAPGYHH